MTRYTKSAHGKYMVSGKSYEALIGTRAQVWHGTAYKTSGGLTKNNIMQNKNGRIVSRAKHASAKRENRLVKAGYGTQKGKFGAVKLNGKSSRRHSKRSRGSRRHGKKRGGLKDPCFYLTGQESIDCYKATGNYEGGKKSRKKRGGSVNFALSPTDYDGAGVGTSGNAVQFAAGNAN